MKKIILACLLLCLVGCAKNNTPITNVCTNNSKEVTLISVGNEIQTMVEKDTYTFQELSVTASFMEKEDHQQQILENYKALYQSVTKGLDITMEVEEDQVVFIITFDFTQADFSELKALGILKDDQINYVGLKETIDAMNLTCYTLE